MCREEEEEPDPDAHETSPRPIRREVFPELASAERIDAKGAVPAHGEDCFRKIKGVVTVEERSSRMLLKDTHLL